MHGKAMRYLIVAGVSVIAGLLIAGTSIRSALPLLFVLACPLMMMFMMGGTHRGADHHQHTARQPEDDPDSHRVH